MAPSLAERTLELIRIASPTGQEKALADVLEAWAKTQFSAAQIHRVGHSFFLGELNDPRPSIALVGHIDTVGAHPAGNVPRIEGDRLFGLGASDMKGSLAVMMQLAESLNRPKLKVNLAFIFYEREEGPFQESGLGPLFEALPGLKKLNFAIAMEPTDGAVQLGCVGSLHAKFVFRGKAAHSARPWQGVNAIHTAGPVLTEMLGLQRRQVTVQGLEYFEVMNATLASGGRTRNVIPDAFELSVNYRFAPGKSVGQALTDLQSFAAGRCEVVLVDAAPSGKVAAENRFAQALISLSERPAEAKQAWTDVVVVG